VKNIKNCAFIAFIVQAISNANYLPYSEMVFENTAVRTPGRAKYFMMK